MSFKNPRLKVAGVSLWDLNPNEIALKNDFQDNLISLAIDSLSVLARLGIADIKILRGVESLSKMKMEKRALTVIDKKFATANALSVNWTNFNKEKIKNLLRDNLDKFENNLSFIIYSDRIELYRSSKRAIEESVDGSLRTFYILSSK